MDHGKTLVEAGVGLLVPHVSTSTSLIRTDMNDMAHIRETGTCRKHLSLSTRAENTLLVDGNILVLVGVLV